MKTLSAICSMFLVTAPAWAAATDGAAIGERAPGFALPGVDGKTHTLSDYTNAEVVVVIFFSNHCPAAKAYQDRIIAFQKDYKGKGVQVFAINANDAEQYPADSFPNMKIRAKEKGYNFPYLYDAAQTVARAYGAKVTPHAFVLDANRNLVYRGRIDGASWQNLQEAGKRYLREAVDAVLAGDAVSEPSTLAFGCSIKWKPGD